MGYYGGGGMGAGGKLGKKEKKLGLCQNASKAADPPHRVPAPDAAGEAEHPMAEGALKRFVLALCAVVGALQQAGAVGIGAVGAQRRVDGVLCHQRLVALPGPAAGHGKARRSEDNLAAAPGLNA